jgi:hypothetical protein
MDLTGFRATSVADLSGLAGMVSMGSRVILRWILAATLLPVILLGLYAGAIQIHRLVRYDPIYFAPEYVEKYDVPGSVARALEGALQSGDQALLAELQGRRRPAEFYTSPSMVFALMLESTDRFFTYSYFDMQSLERHTYHVERIDGRYVIMQSDAYYYLYSGRWLATFLPLAIAWWALVLVVVLAMGVYYLSARMREQMYAR